MTFQLRTLQSQTFNHQLSTPMVQKFMVAKSGLKSSWLKSLGLKGPWLRLRVEKSGVEMYFNQIMDWEWSKVEKVFGTNTNTTFCEFLFFLLFSKGTEGSKGPFCAEVHTLINCIVKNWTDLELHAIWKIAHLPAQSLWRFLSPKIILSQAFFFPLHNPKIVRTKK